DQKDQTRDEKSEHGEIAGREGGLFLAERLAAEDPAGHHRRARQEKSDDEQRDHQLGRHRVQSASPAELLRKPEPDREIRGGVDGGQKEIQREEPDRRGRERLDLHSSAPFGPKYGRSDPGRCAAGGAAMTAGSAAMTADRPEGVTATRSPTPLRSFGFSG